MNYGERSRGISRLGTTFVGVQYSLASIRDFIFRFIQDIRHVGFMVPWPLYWDGTFVRASAMNRDYQPNLASLRAWRKW